MTSIPAVSPHASRQFSESQYARIKPQKLRIGATGLEEVNLAELNKSLVNASGELTINVAATFSNLRLFSLVGVPEQATHQSIRPKIS